MNFRKNKPQLFKIITVSCFVAASVILVMAFITATSYTQLAIAILLYPMLVFYAFMIFPRRHERAPPILVASRHHIAPEQKKVDCLALLDMFEKVTGEKPVMWGSSIIGFGKYHYKSEKSRQEGDWFLVGFSPRKQNLTLYIMHGNNDSTALLEKLGKHKTSSGIGGCLYINKLADVDQTILTKLIETSFNHMKAQANK